MPDLKNNIKELEAVLQLEEGTLENSFIQLDSLSAAELLSKIIQEIIGGIAPSKAVLTRPHMAEGVACLITNLNLLRSMFIEEYADGNTTIH